MTRSLVIQSHGGPHGRTSDWHKRQIGNTRITTDRVLSCQSRINQSRINLSRINLFGLFSGTKMNPKIWGSRKFERDRIRLVMTGSYTLSAEYLAQSRIIQATATVDFVAQTRVFHATFPTISLNVSRAQVLLCNQSLARWDTKDRWVRQDETRKTDG